MAEVWKLRLDGGKRDVLLVMADHADDDGICWPSVGLVAWKTDKQDRSVQRIQRQLEADGIIECIGNPTGGYGKSKIWQLHLDKGVKKSPFKSTGSVREELARLTSGTTSVELDDHEKGDEMSSLSERVTPARETPTPAREKGDVAVSPESSRTVNEPPSPPGDAESVPSVSTYDVMQAIIPAGRQLPKRFKGHLATRVHKLIAEGFDVEILTEAGRRVVQHAKPDPALLDSIVVEVQNERGNGRANGNGHRPFDPSEQSYAGASIR
jgi:hypothetical protein